MSSPDSTDTSRRANSDKENATASFATTGPAASGKDAAGTASSSTITSTRRGAQTRRGKAAVVATSSHAAAAGPVSAAAGKRAMPTSSPSGTRRSTRARSRSASVNLKPADLDHASEEDDELDDVAAEQAETASVASSVVTTGRGAIAAGRGHQRAGPASGAAGKASLTAPPTSTLMVTTEIPTSLNGRTSLPAVAVQQNAQDASNGQFGRRSDIEMDAQRSKTGIHALEGYALHRASESQQELASRAQQRGHGAGVLQTSVRPTEASLKDTSVNIATAFRQAAGVAGANHSHAHSSHPRASTSQTPPYPASSSITAGKEATSNGQSGMNGTYQLPAENTATSVAMDLSASGSRSQDGNPKSASNKRTRTGSSRASRSARDVAWKPSKSEAEATTDDYTSDGAISTDPEDLTKYVENPWGKKVYTVEYEGGGRRHSKRQPRKRKKVENGEEIDGPSEDEDDDTDVPLEGVSAAGQADETTSPASRKRKNPGSASKRVRNPNSQSQRGRSSTSASQTTGHSAGAESIASKDQDGARPRDEASMPLTSYYLHEPSQPPEADPGTTHKPEFKTAEQARLVQTYPKAGVSGAFQPYFAYLTTTIGGQAPKGLASHLHDRSILRARRDTSLSTGTSVDGANATAATIDASGRGPSSTASFDQRGSNYDYAEEERMVEALLAAKGKGQTPTAPIEGRQILPDILTTRSFGQHKPGSAFRDREISVSNMSETSSDVQIAGGNPNTGRASLMPTDHSRQNTLGARRAPAPPLRSPSAFTDSTAGQYAPGNYNSFRDSSSVLDHQEGPSFAEQQAKKKLVHRLGGIIRAFCLMLYYIVSTPPQWFKAAELGTTFKTAGAIILLGLIIGAINEDAAIPLHSSGRAVWHRLPFLRSHSHHQYTPPQAVPSNFADIVQRLMSVEESLRGLADEQAKQFTVSSDNFSLLRESTKRLAGLEGDFEAEKRKTKRFSEALEKARFQELDKTDGSIRSIRNKLDSLSAAMKSRDAEHKAEALEQVTRYEEVQKLQNDLAASHGRLDALAGDLEKGTNIDRTIKVVRTAIEDMLPSRMAVSLDPKTGQVTIDHKFWQYLKSHFDNGGTTGSDGSSHRQSVSWEDFMDLHAEKLHKLVETDVDTAVQRQLQEGVVLSKRSFADLLEKELRKLDKRLSESTTEQVSRVSSDLSGKMAKWSSALTAGNKTPSIKLSSGQDVNEIVNSLIDAALTKYSQDTLAKRDFALYSAGGRIIPSLTSATYKVVPATSTRGLFAWFSGSNIVRGKPPVTALHPDISTGQCWALDAPSGQLGILLSRQIYPSDITVEHASKRVALDISSAPRNFEVWGIVSDADEVQRLALLSEDPDSVLLQGDNLIGNRVLLLQSAYDTDASHHIQTFAVDKRLRHLRIPITAIVFKILDNHGDARLSCLYRVRVGGELAEAGSDEQ